jgi:hypothetical protein
MPKLNITIEYPDSAVYSQLPSYVAARVDTVLCDYGDENKIDADEVTFDWDVE